MSDNLSQTLSARCFLPEQHIPRVKSADRHSKPDDGAKKRGRPRLAPNGDASRMDRRTQVRYAQRTYRHKKEVMYRNMEHRVAELERSISRVSDSLMDFYDVAIESDLHITHPQLFQHLRDTVTDVKRATGGKEERPPRNFVVFPASATAEDTTSFGYMVECSQDVGQGEPTKEVMDNRPPNRGQDRSSHQHHLHIEHPLPGTSTQTYSFQETDPSRILHRYCLEYIYRLFIDPGADPQEFYRVFRLVPCIKWKDKMEKFLLCLVRSGSKDHLDIPALPFYCIGGAGTHYPEMKDGKPVYPEKMRLPRRILGNVMSLVSGKDIKSIDRQSLLKLAGLDGTWLDCRDVVGYLEEKGVLGSNSQVSLGLDNDGFFHSILNNMVILGRSPGFRLRDVEAAFTANLRVYSNTPLLNEQKGLRL
ncbi:hypothetical protein BDV12DRAFT_170082 [Aspergillus spectabilis]